MSYILDALKKSEQERGHGNIPDVQTVHSSSLNYRKEKRTYWPYILITAVILNLALIIYFIIDKEDTVMPPTVLQQNIPSEQPDIEKQITFEENKLTEATPSDIDTNTAETPAKKDTVPTMKAEPVIHKKEAPAIIDSRIIEFYELPDSIKNELPAIIISAHIYSSNPKQRSIVINNNFMEEGEYVLDGLILYEITSDGAIFAYQGTLFNYGVVSGWQ